MSYEYFVMKRAPLAHWVLDDTVPFQDYGGFSISGTKKAGSADPTKSVPLVSGALWSSVFKSTSIGQFACNLFKQGLEDRPFALESWVLPIPKTSGQAARTYRENLYQNPDFANTSLVTAGGGLGNLSVATDTATIGKYVRMTFTSASAAASNNGLFFTAVPATAGLPYSASIIGRVSKIQSMALYLQFLDSGGANIGNNIATVTTTANGLFNLTHQNKIAPAGTATVRILLYGYSGAGTTPWAIGDTIDASKFIIEQSATIGSFFSGATPGYEWVATANNSVSRTVVNAARVNMSNNPSSETNAMTTEGAGTSTVTRSATQTVSGGWSTKFVWATGSHGLSLANGAMQVSPNTTYTISASVYVESGLIPQFIVTDQYYGNTQNLTTITGIGSWQRISKTFTTGATQTAIHSYGIISGAGTYYVDAVLIEESSTLGDFFDGASVGAVWSGTANLSAAYLLVSSMNQQILSHDGQYDGLSINGKVIRFGTAYLTAGTAYCDYDLQECKLAHVVGIHNEEQNQLWVNGVQVASVQITDAQKADTYIATDAYLYSGYTLSSQEIAVNGVAYYPSLTGEQINQNYMAGLNALPQNRVYPQFDGMAFNMNAANKSAYLDEYWVDITDFNRGLKDNVEYAQDQINPAYSAGVSVAGSWTAAVPLDAQGDTSIYGVMVEWSGQGITVETSMDGITWASATNGTLVSTITNGFDPTGKDLEIRVSFAGGSATDTSYLESLHVVALRDNAIANDSVRSVTVTYPAVPRGDFEPNLYRDDNGVSLHGGTLTIGTDATADPWIARTLEVWIKPLSGTPTISVAGTKYRNGVADSTLPIGEWSLIHYVAAADITSAITITGDCIVGQVVLYPSALALADTDFIFKSYTGTPVLRFSDASTIGVSESAVPVAVYAHDWSISAGG